MNDLPLDALRGKNPLGLFAALGALDVATRLLPERSVTLRWEGRLEPTAILTGPDDLDHLVALCVEDLDRWRSSPILTWGPDGTPLADLKPQRRDDRDEFREWLDVLMAEYHRSGDRTDLDLMAALLTEGAFAGNDPRAPARDYKPTHFHFTAGRQLFLTMVRELRDGIDGERLNEALAGPWRYDSPLPVLGWDTRGERIYALRGTDPAKDKKLGVPGADWLAFLGLRFFPVSAKRIRDGRSVLVTTGCTTSWKSGSFTWPLWSVPLTAPVIGSLLADGVLDRLNPNQRKRLGVEQLLMAPIRRSDQGGYGSFGAPGPAPLNRTRG